jgi:hypothetical protein
MNQSTTQTLDSAPPGGVTGGGSKEFRERAAVKTVPPSVEYEPNDPHRVGRTHGRVTFTPEVPARPASHGIVANRVGPSTRSRHG